MWRSYRLPYLLAPAFLVAGYAVGDNAIGVFLMAFGGLLALDASAWSSAAFSAHHFYPDVRWSDVWAEAYNPRSSLVLWSLLSISAAGIAAVRFSGGPEELFLLIMLPIGAYCVAAVLIFRADIIRYAAGAGLQPRPRLDAGDAQFDIPARKEP